MQILRLFGALALLLFSFPLAARTPLPQPEAKDLIAATVRTADGRLAVLVELSDPPVAKYTGGVAGLAATAPEKTGIRLQAAAGRSEVVRYRELLDRKHADFAAQLGARLRQTAVGARYRTVFNGMAVVVPADSVAELAALPGVAAVHPVREYQPTLDASNSVMNAPAFWAGIGGEEQAGAGVKIGILDTGIDFSNPMFSDAALTPPAGFPKGDAALANGKVIVARFFQSSLDEGDANVDPGHRTAQDLVGHGSHSAGVAAGSRVDLSGSGRREVALSGVAPRAWLGSYRVFAPRAFDDNIIAAIEAAVEDGMDVINMSFGGDPLGSPLRDPIIRATQNAIAAGVVATISAGNSGPDPMTVGYPGAAPAAITVGATSNSHYGLSSLGIFELTAASPAVPASLTSVVAGACADQCRLPVSPIAAPIEDVDALDGASNGLACTALPGGSLTGRIALVQRGTCTFAVKGQMVQAAGAIGMILYNSDDPAVSNSGEELFNPSITLASVPALLLRRSDGLTLKGVVGGASGSSAPVGQIRAAPAGTPPFAGSSVAQRLTSFSSRGPTPDLVIKPDVATVGSNSYAPCQDDSASGENRFPAPDPRRGASTMFHSSGFQFAAGTSFSAPRAAGAAALVLQKHPGWTPDLVKAALTETAVRPSDSGKVGGEPVMSRGSGDIDLAAAASVESLVLPTSASFGRVAYPALPHAVTRTFLLKNLSSAAVDYALHAERSEGHASVTASVEPATVRLGPGEERTVTLRVTVGPGIPGEITESGGFLSVTDGRHTIPEELYVPWWIRTVPSSPGEALLRAINEKGK